MIFMYSTFTSAKIGTDLRTTFTNHWMASKASRFYLFPLLKVNIHWEHRSKTRCLHGVLPRTVSICIMNMNLSA